ncbi:hypothetical protein [Marivita sp.]
MALAGCGQSGVSRQGRYSR